MKKLSKLSIGCMLMLLIGGCNNTKEWLEGMNTAPELFFKLQDNQSENGFILRKELNDSLKLNNGFLFTLVVNDVNENVTKVNLVDLVYETGFLLEGSHVIHQELSIEANEDKDLYYSAFEEGRHVIEIFAEDAFGRKSSVVMNLTAFDNLPPKASFQVSKEKEYLYRFDASDSQDRDAKHGGEIRKYIFQIEGQTIVSYTPVIYYRFTRTGAITVSLTVVDDQESSSDAFTRIVEVDQGLL